MHPPTVRIRARAPALAVLFAAGIWIAACDDDRPSGPVALPDGPQHTASYQDSINRGLVQPGPSDEVTVSADPGVSIVSVTPMNRIGFDQPQTMGVVTSGPVRKVTVKGIGAIMCSGSYGSLIGYDSSGAVLGQVALTLIDPADCSPPSWPDNVTHGAQATLELTAGTIARFEITPFSPLTGQVWNPAQQIWVPGNFYQSFLMTVKGPPPELRVTCNPNNPVRTRPVVCTVATSDGSEFLLKTAKAIAADGRYVQQLTPNSTGTSIDWSGVAISSTQIEMTATVGGKDTTAIGGFTVQSRIAQLAGWMDPGLPDNNAFPATPPAPHYDVTSPPNPPFDYAYPGFQTNSDTLSLEGAVGKTIFLYPDKPAIVRQNNGFNAGLAYFQAVTWRPDARYAGHPAGLHLQGSMLPSDAFYKKQRTGNDYCAKRDLDSIHVVLHGHEKRHWNLTRPRFRAANVQGAIEGVVLMPTEPASIGEAVFDAAAVRYAAAADTGAAETHASNQTDDKFPNCQLRPL